MKPFSIFQASTISSSLFIENFIRNVSKSLSSHKTSLEQYEQQHQSGSASTWQREVIRELSRTRIKSTFQATTNQMVVPFEMIVLDSALLVTATRFIILLIWLEVILKSFKYFQNNLDDDVNVKLCLFHTGQLSLLN